ncbi:MAG: hypothetical protein RLZZ618_2966 [Pseudomonadota bacterium]|jgi:hypothetical protein
MKGAASRWSVGVAAFLLVVSLGLPWGSSSNLRTMYHPGWLVPSLCRTVQTWDGWYESVCEPSVLNLGYMSTHVDHETHYGAGHGGRFAVAAGLLLIVLSRVKRRRALLVWAGGTVAVMTVLVSGLGFQSAGSGAAWIAVMLLIGAGLSREGGVSAPPPAAAD